VLSVLPGDNLGARHGAPPADVVALHGWRRSSADFDAVLVGLDAVAPDLPGFGSAAAPPIAWGAADYAGAVAPVCREGPPVVLVGHSFGGKVAVMLAAACPDRVRGLLLTGVPLTAAPVPRASWRYGVARRLNRLGLLGDERLEARRRRTGSDDYRAASGVMRDVLVRSLGETRDGTYLRALGEVRCPVELVWGERDTAAPLPGAADLARAPAGARLTVLPGVGHLTPTEASAELRSALDRLR